MLARARWIPLACSSRPRPSTGRISAAIPDDGWSLVGLAESLRARGRAADAEQGPRGSVRPGRSPTRGSRRRDSEPGGVEKIPFRRGAGVLH